MKQNFYHYKIGIDLVDVFVKLVTNHVSFQSKSAAYKEWTDQETLLMLEVSFSIGITH